jgi:hypothetical protein
MTYKVIGGCLLIECQCMALAIRIGESTSQVDLNFGGACEKDLTLQLEQRGATMRGLHCDAMAQDHASLFESNLFAPRGAPRVNPTPVVIKYPFANSAD